MCFLSICTKHKFYGLLLFFLIFFSKFLQILEFQMWIFDRKFGRSAENSTRNILLPQILTKTILSKIDPLHHLKIEKVVPPQKWPFFLGGVRKLYVTYPNNNLNWQAIVEKLFFRKCIFFFKFFVPKSIAADTQNFLKIDILKLSIFWSNYWSNKNEYFRKIMYSLQSIDDKW